MNKIKKTLRIEPDLDINPADFGFKDFTEFANTAMRNLIEQQKTNADAAAELVDEISTLITNFEAQNEYDEENFTTQDADFLDRLNLCYDLLINTDLIEKNPKLQVYIDDPDMLEIGEDPYWRHKHAYSASHEHYREELENFLKQPGY